MKIRKFRKSDTKRVTDIIRKTAPEFVKKDFTKKSLKRYIDFYDTKKNLKKIEKSFRKTNIFFVAEENNKIAGLIRGEKDRIRNLFVHGKYHKMGIATKLIKRFEKEAIKKKSKNIKIFSSSYALPFYQKMNYKKTTGKRIKKDVEGYPVKKILK